MQSLLSKDYFSLFGLAPSFSIDAAVLTERYREMQHAVHPDRYAGATERERRYSVQLAAHINAAYQTLRQPLSRAHYLLTLSGETPDDNRTALATEFLHEQMEWREELQALAQGREPAVAVAAFRRRLERRVAEVQEGFAAAMTAEGDRPAALTRFSEMQFLYRLMEELGRLEEEIENR